MRHQACRDALVVLLIAASNAQADEIIPTSAPPESAESSCQAGLADGRNFSSILILQNQRFYQPEWLVPGAGGLNKRYGCGHKPGFKLPSADLDVLLRRPKRCAVVGSSALLLTSAMGAEIDGHDAIFRINDAPSGGPYGSHVGNRTDVRMGNILIHNRPRCPPSRGGLGKRNGLGGRQAGQAADLNRATRMNAHRSKSSRSRQVAGRRLAATGGPSCREEGTLYVTNVMANKPTPRHHNESHHVLSEGFLSWAPREVGQERGFPSSGVLTTLIASRVCGSVDLYGFDFFSCPNGKRHYYRETDGSVSKPCADESWLNHQWLLEELYIVKHYHTRCHACTFPRAFSSLEEHARTVSLLKTYEATGGPKQRSRSFEQMTSKLNAMNTKLTALQTKVDARAREAASVGELRAMMKKMIRATATAAATAAVRATLSASNESALDQTVRKAAAAAVDAATPDVTAAPASSREADDIGLSSLPPGSIMPSSVATQRGRGGSAGGRGSTRAHAGHAGLAAFEEMKARKAALGARPATLAARSSLQARRRTEGKRRDTKGQGGGGRMEKEVPSSRRSRGSDGGPRNVSSSAGGLDARPLNWRHLSRLFGKHDETLRSAKNAVLSLQALALRRLVR